MISHDLMNIYKGHFELIERIKSYEDYTINCMLEDFDVVFEEKDTREHRLLLLKVELDKGVSQKVEIVIKHYCIKGSN